MARQSSAQRYLLAFAASAVTLLAAVALLNWCVDPFQYYRRAAYPPEFSRQARYQNPGLARNYDYDTVIIGTSVSFGFDLRDLSAQTGWRPLNLAMQGASPHEQRLLLDAALRTGRVKRVIWDLNYEFFRGNWDWVSDFDGSFPAYLYDQNPLTKVTNYLLNVDITKASLRILLRLALRGPAPLTLEDLTIPPGHDAGAAALLKSWTMGRERPWPVAQKAREFSLQNTRENFDWNVLSAIQAYPDVTWDLWFPPHSTAYHSIMRQQIPAAWETMFGWKRYIRAQTSSLPQVNLCDFQGFTQIVSTPDHYIDMVHFDLFAHRLLLHEMIGRKELATPASLSDTETFLRNTSTPEAVDTLLKAPWQPL